MYGKTDSSEFCIFKFFQFNDASFHFVMLHVSLNAVSSSLKCVILIEQLLVCVVPSHTIFLFELLFVFIHEAHEVHSKVVSKVEFASNIVRNRSQICKDANTVGLLIIIRIIEVIISHQLVSISDVWTKIGKVFYIFGVTHERIPWCTLDLSSIPSYIFELIHEI